MKKITIPYGKQYINNQDIKSVSRSLRNEFITTGSSVKNFEMDIRKKVKSKYAYTCINGTAGLHLAYLSIECFQRQGPTCKKILPNNNCNHSHGLSFLPTHCPRLQALSSTF